METQTSKPASDMPRALWPRLLAALPPEQVVRSAHRLCADFRIDPLLPALEGLGLLRMREGCLGEHYHLGEFPLAQAALELVDANGQRFPGGARVLSSSAEYAQAVAMLDALLAHQLCGSHEVLQLLAEGRDAVERIEARRAEIRERTRVEFSLLSSAALEPEHDEI